MVSTHKNPRTCMQRYSKGSYKNKGCKNICDLYHDMLFLMS